MRRKRFIEDSFLQVDWDANKAAMAATPLARRHWVTKFESGCCGTGRMMKMWKKRVIDNCPRCGKPNETTTHILQCQCDSAQRVWEGALLSLDEWLYENRTCPDLRKLLQHILYRWKKGLEVTPLRDYDFEACKDVFVSQQQIGWRQLMGGCLSVEWARVQQSYYQWRDIRRTGKRWAISLIRKLWEIAWDLWDDRNDLLHSTPLAADLNGAASLDKAIREECLLGSEGLPVTVQRLFPIDVEKLIKTSLLQRKAWLVSVRAARELLQDTRIQDEFTNPKSYLRKWVGLQDSK